MTSNKQIATFCLAISAAAPTMAYAYSPVQTVATSSERVSDKVVSLSEIRRLQAWTTVARHLEALKLLSVNWDGDGGVPPTAATLRHSAVLLEEIQGLGLPAPELFATGEGEVGLKWRSGSQIASVSVMPDDHVVAYVAYAGARPPLEIDKPFDEETLVEVLSGLGAFA